jgi:hypothetical protein
VAEVEVEWQEIDVVQVELLNANVQNVETRNLILEEFLVHRQIAQNAKPQ